MTAHYAAHYAALAERLSGELMEAQAEVAALRAELAAERDRADRMAALLYAEFGEYAHLDPVIREHDAAREAQR